MQIAHIACMLTCVVSEVKSPYQWSILKREDGAFRKRRDKLKLVIIKYIKACIINIVPSWTAMAIRSCKRILRLFSKIVSDFKTSRKDSKEFSISPVTSNSMIGIT